VFLATLASIGALALFILSETETGDEASFAQGIIVAALGLGLASVASLAILESAIKRTRLVVEGIATMNQQNAPSFDRCRRKELVYKSVSIVGFLAGVLLGVLLWFFGVSTLWAVNTAALVACFALYFRAHADLLQFNRECLEHLGFGV
jgi:hypothetical protein